MPLSFKKTQPQLWDIKHNVFSQSDKIGNWRQQLKFNAKTKTFILNNYSSRSENLGANKIEEFLTATSNSKLEPLFYNYIIKNNNKIVKSIKARFYKKWKLTRLKKLRKRFLKKRKVQSFKKTNQLWVEAETKTYTQNKVFKKIVKKSLPSPVFLSSYLSLVLSQKLTNRLDNKWGKTKLNPAFKEAFSFISFSEESLKLENGQAQLVSNNNSQSSWQAHYKNYSFNSTMDKKGKLLKTSMPLRQLRSQLITL